MTTRTVDIWGGVLTLGGGSAGAGPALCDVGADLTAGLQDLPADLDLLAERALDVLPRSGPARRAAEARRQIAQAARITDEAALPPALVALPGALADGALISLTESDGIEGCFAAASHAAAMNGMPAPLGSTSDLLADLAATLDRPDGGLAVSGLAGPHPGTGIADSVVAVADGAASAAMAAALIAEAVAVADRAIERGAAAGLYAPAFDGMQVTVAVGRLGADTIWEALSAGVRRASALKDAGAVRAAVLTLKGRGRTVGPADPDRLLRFGVSEWR